MWTKTTKEKFKKNKRKRQDKKTKEKIRKNKSTKEKNHKGQTIIKIMAESNRSIKNFRMF